MSVSTPEASHEPNPGNIHQAPPPHPLYYGEQQQHLGGGNRDATYEINFGHGATTWSSHTRIRESEGLEDIVAQAKKQRRKLAVEKGVAAAFWIIVIVGLSMLLCFVIVPAVQKKIAEAEAEGQAKGSETYSAMAQPEQPEQPDTSSHFIDFGNGTILQEGEVRTKPGTLWKLNSTGRYFESDIHLWDKLHGRPGWPGDGRT